MGSFGLGWEKADRVWYTGDKDVVLLCMWVPTVVSRLCVFGVRCIGNPCEKRAESIQTQETDGLDTSIMY